MFWLFRRRKRLADEEEDPLAAFDALIAAKERQAAEVRRSAATLLALRGQLERERDRHQRRFAELERGLERAAGNRGAEGVLLKELSQTRALLVGSEAALSSTEEDAQLLLETADRLVRQVRELVTERQSAIARWEAGRAAIEGMRQQAENIREQLAIERARDEVERARQLAQLWREEGPDRGRR